MMSRPDAVRLSVSPHRLRAHLRRGGVIAYPTEFCYGIGAAPQSHSGLEAVLRLKKRPQHKGMIVIGHNLPQLRPLLQRLPENVSQALCEQWPAAKTFLLPAANGLLPQLRGKGRTKLAVRVPDSASARTLCRLAAMPLVSTSCNRSGGRPCRTEREVRRQFGRKLLLIGGRTGGYRRPSAIVDWESGNVLR